MLDINDGRGADFAGVCFTTAVATAAAAAVVVVVAVTAACVKGVAMPMRGVGSGVAATVAGASPVKPK
jgi:hypothetical protein